MSAEIDVRADVLEGQKLLLIPKGNMTQTTSITTAVTVNETQGAITTVTPSISAGTTVSFTVNNNTMLYNTLVFLTPIYPLTGTGIPVVMLASSNENGFVVSIANAHPSAPVNTAITINFFTC